MSENLAEKVRRFPDAPGVYLIKNNEGKIIYVGKARSLKQRVRSYLAGNGSHSARLKALQSQMSDIDFIVTDTEVEALILECNLIKENRPRYNVNLKDDKDYPCLRLTGGLYPRLEYLRLSQKEGRRRKRTKEAAAAETGQGEALYFGPYTNAGAVRDTVRLLGKIFPLRRCRQPLNGEPSPERPCLNFQMKRCLAPCRGGAVVSPQEYAGLVRRVSLFLEGQQGELEKDLAQRMRQAAQAEHYEEAARLRDQLQAVRQVAARQQKVLSVKKALDQDILALARRGREAAVHLFKVREGKLLSQEHFPLSGAGDAADEEAMAAFIKSYYGQGAKPPAEIVLSHDPGEIALIQQWLRREAGRKVLLVTPRRGSRKELVELARRNGLLKLEEGEQRTRRRERLPLLELARLAGLTQEPGRIEGYDISHLRGNEAVGVMVVFEEGRPSKDQYRHFLLRHTPAGDDYAALGEVLSRRARRRDWPLPGLILIDGGKGQLSAARDSLSRSGLTGPPLLALAKDPDRIFLEVSPEPVILPADNPMLQLLQRIRDEAHRFAVDYHRRLRLREATRSPLEDVAGIGPKRRSVLLDHFGGMAGIYQATVEQLQAVPGFDRELARRLFQHLHS